MAQAEFRDKLELNTRDRDLDHQVSARRWECEGGSAARNALQNDAKAASGPRTRTTPGLASVRPPLAF